DLFGGQGLGEETISDQESGEEEDHRIVEIDGKTYELGHADKWFYGLNERGGKWLNGDEIGLVKLHVLVDSPQDLARVQAALIPELMNAPYVAKFKTMDPLHWTSRADQALGDAPSGRGQGAKGITVYLEKPKKGLFVTRSGAHGILSDVVASNGLERRPVPGESVGKVDRTGRVVLVRDEFRRAIPSRLDNSGLYGGLLIDPIIARQIERESRKALRVDRRRKFTYDELRRIEQRLGLMSGTLVYGRLKGEPRNKARLMLTHGHTRQIEVSRKLAERLAAGKAPLEQDEYEYASEEREGRDFGELSGRFAMYALARRYGLDAADLAVESKQILIENSLEPGESVLLGRRTESMSDQEIEREHAVVGRDKKGRWYILNRDPAHGTWLEGPGGGKRRLKPNEKVLLGDHSKIIRGDYPNVSLGRWWLRWINVHRPD
ncbi:MAG TPA: FHA domain-containing protein, partial [Planctomycetota bacterium]|nr:FHA domain-containing protein [Planctomycetota bacterium]